MKTRSKSTAADSPTTQTGQPNAPAGPSNPPTEEREPTIRQDDETTPEPTPNPQGNQEGNMDKGPPEDDTASVQTNRCRAPNIFPQSISHSPGYRQLQKEFQDRSQVGNIPNNALTTPVHSLVDSGPPEYFIEIIVTTPDQKNSLSSAQHPDTLIHTRNMFRSITRAFRNIFRIIEQDPGSQKFPQSKPYNPGPRWCFQEIKARSQVGNIRN
jgi:hypothetical protein